MLREWCELCWKAYIAPTIKGSGSLKYHECCCCFSRKGFDKKSRHPEEMSISIRKIPELKTCKTATEFTDWLVERLDRRARNGKPEIFPAINCYHESHLSEGRRDENFDESFLAKRTAALEEQVGYHNLVEFIEEGESKTTLLNPELAQTL